MWKGWKPSAPLGLPFSNLTGGETEAPSESTASFSSQLLLRVRVGAESGPRHFPALCPAPSSPWATAGSSLGTECGSLTSAAICPLLSLSPPPGINSSPPLLPQPLFPLSRLCLTASHKQTPVAPDSLQQEAGPVLEVRLGCDPRNTLTSLGLSFSPKVGAMEPTLTRTSLA